MVAERSRATSSWVDCRYALSSKWPLILLTASFALLAGSFLGSREGPVYKAVAQVSLLGYEKESLNPRASTELRPSSLNTLRRREASLRSGVLMLQVIDASGLVERWKSGDRLEALQQLRDQLRIEKNLTSGLYEIAMHSSSPGEAAGIANALALEFVAREQSKTRVESESTVRSLAGEIESRRAVVDEIEAKLIQISADSKRAAPQDEAQARDLRRRLVNVSNIIRSLEAKHQRAVLEMQSVSSGVTLAKKADVEEAERIQRKWQKAGVSCLLGLIVSSGLVLLFSAGRSPFTVLSRISENFCFGVVGVAPVPSMPLLRLSHPPDSVIEPYRDLRTKIHRLPASDCSVLSLVPESGDSSPSEVAVNLATVLADAGHTVLLIDADLRGARMHELIDAAKHPGLSDYLKGEMRIEETVIKSRRSNLWCMPSGPMVDDPGGLLGSKRMNDLFREMKSRFDYILMTSPSIQTHSDAGVLSGYADHAFIVSSYLTHSLSRLKKVHYALESSGAWVSGAILAFSTDLGSWSQGSSRRRSHHAPSRVGSSSRQRRVRA